MAAVKGARGPVAAPSIAAKVAPKAATAISWELELSGDSLTPQVCRSLSVKVHPTDMHEAAPVVRSSSVVVLGQLVVVGQVLARVAVYPAEVGSYLSG
jgi:hypothetical protein